MPAASAVSALANQAMSAFKTAAEREAQGRETREGKRGGDPGGRDRRRSASEAQAHSRVALLSASRSRCVNEERR